MELYHTSPHPPPWENIPTSVMTAHIDDSITTEEEFVWEVQRLWGQKSGGPSWMRTQHLWEWLQEHQAE